MSKVLLSACCLLHGLRQERLPASLSVLVYFPRLYNAKIHTDQKEQQLLPLFD